MMVGYYLTNCVKLHIIGCYEILKSHFVELCIPFLSATSPYLRVVSQGEGGSLPAKAGHLPAAAQSRPNGTKTGLLASALCHLSSGPTSIPNSHPPA